MRTRGTLIPPEKARNAKKESKQIDFKESFNISQAGEWCEIIKDIAAMANSGGGWIIIGAKNNGTPSGADTQEILNADPALITDKMFRYTREQFSDFDIQEIEKESKTLAAIQVAGTDTPLVFTQPGSYDIGQGKQKTAFARGTIYFRHGAKSEPANGKDLKDFINRQVEKVRKTWLGGIRKVITAPKGHTVAVLPKEVIESDQPGAAPIRIVDDPSAPAYRKIDPNQTHPHRQTEVVNALNQKFGEKKVSSYDIQCVRKIYGIDETKPKFYYKPKYGSPQYSNALVEWIIEQYEKDNQFLNKTKEECKK